MDFTLFSLGDAAFLYAVLNAVASIPQDTYMTLGGLGAILGLLIMGMKGANEGSLMKAGFQGLLVSLVIFWVLFIPRVDRVVIKDMAPPPTAPPMYVVDNVPMGFAFVGTVTSRVGVFLARLFDQAFGDVDESRVLSGGVGDNLRRITMLRHMADPVFVEASGDKALSLLRANLARYMAQCTMTGLTTGELANRTLTTKTDANADGVVNALDGMYFPHQALQTRLMNLEGGMEDPVSCAQGQAKALALSGYTSGGGKAFEASFDAVFQNKMTFQSTIDTMEDMGLADGAQWAQSAMINQVAAAATAQAVVAGGTSQGGMMAAMMVEEASARRNVQFAGEQNMFLRTMRTTIGFFEAVFYALGPVMAILIMTGPMGVQIASKYVLMTVWVLLWYPMIAIINLYGNVKMQSLVTELAANPDYLTTPIGTHQVLVMAQDQLGSVAALVASTPVLAMSLIYGGAVAMNAVASRIGGGDQIDEGKLAPQAMETAPAMQAGSMATASVGAGMGTTGISQPKISVGSEFNEALSATSQRAVQASQAFTSSVDQMFSSGSEYSKAWGRDMDAVRSSSYESGVSSALDFGRSQGLNVDAASSYRESLSQEKREAFDMALGAGIAKGGIGGKVGWSQSEIEAWGKLSADEQRMINAVGREASENLGMRASYADGVKTSISDSLSERGATKLAESASESLGRSESEIRSASETISSQESRSAGISANQSLDLGAFVQNWRRDAESNLESFPATVGAAQANFPSDLVSEYEAQLHQIRSGKTGFTGSDAEMSAAAMALTLQNHGDMNNPEHAQALLNVMGRGSGMGAGGVTPGDSADLVTRVTSATSGVGPGSPGVVAAGAIEGPSGSAADVRGAVGGGFDAANASIAGANASIGGGRAGVAGGGETFGLSGDTILSGDRAAVQAEGDAHLQARADNAGGAMRVIQDHASGVVQEQQLERFGGGSNWDGIGGGYEFNRLADVVSSANARAADTSLPVTERDAARVEAARATLEMSYLPPGSYAYGQLLKENGLYEGASEQETRSNFQEWASQNVDAATKFEHGGGKYAAEAHLFPNGYVSGSGPTYSQDAMFQAISSMSK